MSLQNDASTLIIYLITFSSFLGLFLGVVLIANKRGNRRANSILAVLLILISFHLGKHLIFEENQTYLTPQIYLLTQSLTFCFGPLLFIYAKSLLGQRVRFLNASLHFSPVIISLILIALFLQNLNKPKNHEIQDSELIIGQSLLFFQLQLVHLIIYNIKVARLIMQVKSLAKEFYSSLKIKMKWLWNTCLILAINLTGVLITYFLLISGGFYSLNKQIDFIYLTLLSFSIEFIAFKLILNPEIFTVEEHAEVGILKKYQKSTLSPETSKELSLHLEKFMAREKPYFNSELKLIDLAKELRMKPNHLSQVINENFNQNFFEFINSYRIKEAVNLLRGATHASETIIGIAFEVGFNSKATFNRTFKKVMNQTPSQFLKILRSN